MILRWYMALSEFTFKLEFIAGLNNNIADATSRLCRNNMIDHPKEYSIRTYSICHLDLKQTKCSSVFKDRQDAQLHFGVQRTLKRFIDSTSNISLRIVPVIRKCAY